jgi:hypothetical protein
VTAPPPRPPRPGILSLLAILLYAGQPCAGELKPPPVQTPPESAAQDPSDASPSPPSSGILRVEVSDGRQALVARVSVDEPDGRSALPPPLRGRWVVDGCAELTLPAGQYILRVHAGPRRTVWRQTALVRRNTVSAVSAVLEPFFPLREAGYRTLDPFASIQPGEGSLHTVLSLASASGVELLGVPSGFLTAGGGNHAPLLPVLTTAEVGRFYALPGKDSDDPGALLEKLPFWKRSATLQALGWFTVWRHSDGPEGDIARGLESPVAQKPGAGFFFATVAGPLYEGLDVTDAGFGLELWEFLLRQGYRVQPMAGGPGGAAEALPRVSAYLTREERAGAFDPDGVTCVGTGPFLAAFVDGAPMGGALAWNDHKRLLEVEVYSSSDRADSIQSVDLVHNGRLLRRYDGAPNERAMKIEDQLDLHRGGYLYLRYRSRADDHFAVTPSIRIERPGAPAPVPPTTRLRVRCQSRQSAAPCVVEIRNLGALLGRYRVPPAGRTFQVPPTADILVLAEDGGRLMRTTVYRQSGAAALTERLAGVEPDELRKALLSEETYARMRFLLEDVSLTVDLDAAAAGDGPDAP